MASHGMTLYPYMNARGITAQPGLVDNAVSFSYTGTATIKYGVETAGTNKPTNFVVYGMGLWGGLYANHAPVLMIVDAYPGTFVTYGSEAIMQADLAQPYGINSYNDDGGTYGKVGSEYWFFTKSGSWGPMWVPVRQKTAAGTATIEGVACDLYTVTIDIVDFPRLMNESMDADEHFELCWAQNGRHAAQGWDALFYLTPAGFKLHGNIMGRTELNTPVAGEKARFEDEFPTAGQLEAGNGISILYRTRAGAATGYATLASKGFNIILESTGVLGVRENEIGGIDLGTGIAASWTAGTAYTPINEISFTSEIEWQLDNALARTGIVPGTKYSPSESIPVFFDIVESPSGKARVMARTYHNGLYVSHDTYLVPSVTQFNAAPNNTIQHLQFADTATVTFSITEQNIDNGGGDYRHGVVITANAGSSSVTVGKEKVPISVTDAESNANVATLVYTGVNTITFADSVWAYDHSLETQLQYHPDVQWVQDSDGVVNRWRTKIPSRHLPINFYARVGDAGETMVSASVAAPGLRIGSLETTAYPGVMNYNRLPGETGIGPLMEWTPSATFLSDTTHLIVEQKKYWSIYADEGDAHLVLENVELQPATGTISADDVINSELLRLDARTIGGSARIDRHYTPETVVNMPTVDGYQITADGLLIGDPIFFGGRNVYQVALPREMMMWGKQRSGDLSYAGTMNEPSLRYTSDEIVRSIGSFRPGIYRVNVTVLGRSKMPVTVNTITPGQMPPYRGFSRIKLHLAELNATFGPNGVTCPNPVFPNAAPIQQWYSIGDIHEDRDIHPAGATDSSGEWCLQGDFLLPISDASMFPFGYISGIGPGRFSIVVEVEYPYGRRENIDRVYYARQCYVDLHFIEQYPRKPYNIRPRII